MSDGSLSDGGWADILTLFIDKQNGSYNKYSDTVFQILEDGMKDKYNSYNVQIYSGVPVTNDIMAIVDIDMDVQDNVAHGFLSLKTYGFHELTDGDEYEAKYEFYRTYDGSETKTYFNIDGSWIVKTSKPFFDNVALGIDMGNSHFPGQYFK
jgi:hypothetical protein